MSKTHLVFYGITLSESGHRILKVSGWDYWRKRLKFWEWKQHQTMGKPILVLRKVWQKYDHQ